MSPRVRPLVTATIAALVSLSALPDPMLVASGRGTQRIGTDPLVADAVSRVTVEHLREDLTTLVGFGTRHTRSDTDSDDRGIGAARRWLRDQFAAIEKDAAVGMRVELQAHLVGPGPRMPGGTELVNVVATLPGSDPDRVIVISGHMDSRNSSDADIEGDAPGANDDGSGTVLVLEAARAICGALSDARVAAARDGRPFPRLRASIRFAAVAGEEQGLWGSRAMAEADREDGVDVIGMITNDIVGGVGGGNGMRNRGLVRLFSEGVPSSEDAARVTGSDNDAPSRQLARVFAEAGVTYVPALETVLVFRQDRYLRGGDHRAYNEVGYAGIRFTDMYEHFDRQHQDVRTEDGREYGDTLEHIDYFNLADVARVNVAGVLGLALAPPAPTDVRVDISVLSHDTRLLWADPRDAQVAGYRVRMRPTDAPRWTESRDVGLVHEVTLEGISKDDVLFAVEAYDAEGRTSTMVYPRPGR